jgi:hypothetical protein
VIYIPLPPSIPSTHSLTHKAKIQAWTEKKSLWHKKLLQASSSSTTPLAFSNTNTQQQQQQQF